MTTFSYDAFISHASEDKEAIVQPLAEELLHRGVKLWYDSYILSVGDKLRRSLDDGLAQSRFGIIVLSKNFFLKEWPQRELDALLSLEADGVKRILPVWHQLNFKEVSQRTPLLADRISATTSAGTSACADQLIRAIFPNKNTPLNAADVFQHLERGRVNGVYDKNGIANFLDEVAKEAKLLADTWQRLYELYEKGTLSEDGLDELKAMARQTEFSQIGHFSEVKMFYEHVGNIFVNTPDSRIKEDVVSGMARLIDFRVRGKEIMEGFSGLREDVWMYASFGKANKPALQEAVNGLQQEASRLNALSKLYKLNLSI